MEELCNQDAKLIPQLRQAITLELTAKSTARETVAASVPKQGSLLPTIAPEDISNAASAAGAADEWSKPRIDGFELIRPLGEGGMGVVWLAKQLATQREVAVKLLSSALLGLELTQLRFAREVELAANLDHPAIATIFESGVNRGIFYYAMEYVRGLPLDQFVKEKGLSHRQILELLCKICSGVQHAHQRGVIHRDLKPSNTLGTGLPVRRGGEEGNDLLSCSLDRIAGERRP